MYRELDYFFDNDEFAQIDRHPDAYKFYLLRSISKKKDLVAFCDFANLEYTDPINSTLERCFSSRSITSQLLEEFIRRSYIQDRAEMALEYNTLIGELNRLETFDWGGSYQNSLERNIVNNYVKKMQNYNQLLSAIEGDLAESLKGYTLNSWYNHWTSILIEYLFKDHENVLPTIGQIKKIDFFIGQTPWDLKVTYFPEELLKQELRNLDFGIELTQVRRKAREIGIPIPTDLNDRSLNVHLQNILSESTDERAISFLRDLNSKKSLIINQKIENPEDLIIWLYENQGSRRFDAGKRIFLILIDKNNMFESWKLKRNITFLRSLVNDGIENIINGETYNISFNWEGREYRTEAAIVFVVRD